MSVKVMNDVWSDPPVGGSPLLVLLAIADNADEERRTGWPSIPTLARKTRLSESTVHRAISELVRLGVVVKTVRSGRSTLYRVTPLSDWQGSQIDTPVTGDTPTPVTGDTPPLSPVTPEPSENHQEEPSEVAPPVGDASETLDLDLPQPASVSAYRRENRDMLWEAVMEVCGIDSGSITRSARGGYNRAVADLRAVAATPEQVHDRAMLWPAAFPGATLTPNALARHWSQLANVQPTGETPRVLAEHEQMLRRMADLDAREANG